MLRSLAFRVFIPTSMLAAAAGGALAQGGTIRIEPRPFYGATVTLEEGVRVFRPLPPDRYVIINPDHRTPLSLGISDTRVYEQRNVNNYDRSSGPEANYPNYVGRPGYGLPLGNGHRGDGKHVPRIRGF